MEVARKPIRRLISGESLPKITVEYFDDNNKRTEVGTAIKIASSE